MSWVGLWFVGFFGGLKRGLKLPLLVNLSLGCLREISCGLLFLLLVLLLACGGDIDRIGDLSGVDIESCDL